VADSLDRLLNIQEIYYEPAVLDYARGQEILARYPEAHLIETASHWNIPELHGNEESVENWNRVKRTVLVLGVKKSIQARPNCRSSDFVAPSHSNGCAMACSYCYVARRKGCANPITTFVNIEQIQKYLQQHAAKQEVKLGLNQFDPQC
jgi:spore photoproduct lyase